MMARPALITITGTYLKVNGAPESGTVTFRSKTSVLSSTTDTIMSPSPLVAVLDEAGSFSVALPSTTDPTWSPVGWTYEVHVRLSESITTFNVMIPHDASAGDLRISELVPVGPSGGNLYAPYSHTHEGLGGGGGEVVSVAGRTGVVVLTKTDVGLPNVDNTADSAKPISTATQTALDGKAATSHSHAASDISSGTLAISRIPTGTSGTTVALGNDSRFTDSRTPTAHAASHTDGGSDEISVSQAQVVDLEDDLASFTTAIASKAPTASPTFTGTVSGITSAMVGLGNVNNTSDASKPISTATQAALDAKAPSASPTFTGTVSGITKAMVGLPNVDNTSDASKPVSTATQTALDGKAATSHSHAVSDVTGLQTALDDKAASSHTHTIANVTGLQTALDGKQAAGSYATSTELTALDDRVADVEDITPSIMLWNGSAYVEAPTAKIYVGPTDPGAVPDGSVWIEVV